MPISTAASINSQSSIKGLMGKDTKKVDFCIVLGPC
jgi:hypothetical protein